MLVYKQNNQWTPWQGEPLGLGGIYYQLNIEQLWSRQDLASLGLYVPAPFVTPAGKVAFGTRSYVDAPDGTPMEHYEVSDPPVPTSVTPLQARRALRQVGLIDTVNASVAAADQDTKDAWEYTNQVDRTNPIVVNLAKQLNLSDATLDNLFKLASTL